MSHRYLHSHCAMLKAHKDGNHKGPGHHRVTEHHLESTSLEPQLANLLLDLSKSSSILHTESSVKGYSRPLSSVVSRLQNEIFDERKLFYGVLENASGRELKTVDLSKKVSDNFAPEREDHLVLNPAVQTFTSNEQARAKSKTPPTYVKKLSNDDKELKVDLDSVLSFLNKNVR